MYNNKQKRGFTLVELIVVITILAILGTIAFISMQQYSKSARDSARLSDMSKIRTTLELFHLNAGKYPASTDFFDVRYSGALAWTQGVFGNQTFLNVENLDKIPLDPLTDRKYVYSVTNNKQEFEIGGIMETYEGGTLGSLISNDTYAGDRKTNMKISGTYNGKLLKVSTGGLTYILAVPSIITSTGGTLKYIIDNKSLAYDGYQNLPVQYSGSVYDVEGEDGGLVLVNPDYLEVYSGSSLDPLNEDDSTGESERTKFVENLQGAYLGTALENEGGIKEIVNATSSGEIEFVATTIISTDLGGDIEVTGTPPNISTGGSEGEEGGEVCLDTMELPLTERINTYSPGYLGDDTLSVCNFRDFEITFPFTGTLSGYPNNIGEKFDVYASFLSSGTLYEFNVQNNGEGSFDSEILLFKDTGEGVVFDEMIQSINGNISEAIELATTGTYYIVIVGEGDYLFSLKNISEGGGEGGEGGECVGSISVDWYDDLNYTGEADISSLSEDIELCNIQSLDIGTLKPGFVSGYNSGNFNDIDIFSFNVNETGPYFIETLPDDGFDTSTIILAKYIEGDGGFYEYYDNIEPSTFPFPAATLFLNSGEYLAIVIGDGPYMMDINVSEGEGGEGGEGGGYNYCDPEMDSYYIADLTHAVYPENSLIHDGYSGPSDMCLANPEFSLSDFGFESSNGSVSGFPDDYTLDYDVYGSAWLSGGMSVNFDIYPNGESGFQGRLLVLKDDGEMIYGEVSYLIDGSLSDNFYVNDGYDYYFVIVGEGDYVFEYEVSGGE